MNCIDVKLTAISRDCIEVELGSGESFRLPFSRYPWFEYCTIRELEQVQCDGMALEWPEAMIDLELDLLRHPEREGTITPVEKWLKVRDELRRRAALREHARKAGSATTPRKAAASRANGSKGGRPRVNRKEPALA